MENKDILSVVEKYRAAFNQHGYSPKSLGWDKGRQDIRFKVLLSFFECRGKSILDIGCGFGDLNNTLLDLVGDDYKYLGVDMVEELIIEGRKHYDKKNVQLLTVNFLDHVFTSQFDIVIASGIFNYNFPSGNNNIFVEEVIKKAWSLCTEGIAFDFLSDKVDYRHDHTHHNNPEHILRIAYTLSRNVVLRNDYIPFEFCLYLGKDNSFDPNNPVFNSHKEKNK